jgi:hypothetical protein
VLSPDQYEIVDVRTSRGVRRAMLFPKAILKAERRPMPRGARSRASNQGALWGGGSGHEEVIMQNLPAQSVNAPEKVRCLRNNTPNHALTDLKARQLRP